MDIHENDMVAKAHSFKKIPMEGVIDASVLNTKTLVSLIRMFQEEI